MNRFISIVIHAILLLATTMSPACSDDLPHLSPRESHTGLTLMVPSMPQFSTRAEGLEAAADELAYSSLWFFAFPQGEGKAMALDLSGSHTNALDFKDNYKGYTIELNQGSYNLYLVANYTDINENITEENLKAKLIVYQVQDSKFNGGIPEGGIPMSCDNSGFYVVEDSGTSSYLAGTFDYDGTSDVSLYADLTFACAKVTVNANGFSGNNAEITELKASHLSKQVPFISMADYNGYGMLEDATVMPAGNSPLTFYIPERIVAEASKADQSSLSLRIGDKTITIPLGEKTEDTTDGVNPLPAFDDLRAIRRGSHYIYTLNEKGEVTFAVKPWTPLQLLYELHGPYFLHLEKTEYPVTAGEITSIWYESDADIIEVESPVYKKDGKDIPLYNWNVNAEKNIIEVWVNPEIKAADFDAIMKDTDGNYNYFHIRANGLHKKISVSPLNLKNYLNVTPQNISIDVREQIASGNYNSFFQIDIDTNLPKIKVERATGWDQLPQEEWGDNISVDEYVIKLTDSNDVRVPTGTNPVDYASNSEYRLHFSGLNSGKQTWQTTRQLTFTVTACDEDGTVMTETLPDGSVANLTRTVTINIIPNILNYKIHFHADGWTNPHIYVYQCLEFPSKMAAGKEYLANQPIATNNTGTTAALEYSFTGKLAFKGWNVGDYNNPNQPVSTNKVQGFYYFTDDTNSWSPTDDEFTRHYYNNMDFCYSHREQLKNLKESNASTYNYICSECYKETYAKTGDNNVVVQDGYNRLWPGIQMLRETDGNGNYTGWWYFELTGVAVPGKALIMFADGHYYKDIYQRFPGNDAVGIPLFDFPNREGWLDYNGNQTDRLGNTFSPDGPKQYRLYWPESKGSGIHLWMQENGKASDITTFGKANGILENGFYHYDFRLKDKEEAYLSRQYSTIGESTNLINFIKLGQFKHNGSGIYCCTMYENDYVEPGIPDPTYLTPFKGGIKLRIKWKKMSADKIHVWSMTPNKDFTSWPGDKTGESDEIYYYFDFEIEEACERIGYRRTRNNTNVDQSDMFLRWFNFKNNYNSESDRYIFTIE